MKNKSFTMRASSGEILTKGIHLHHWALHFLFFRITDCSCFFEFKFCIQVNVRHSKRRDSFLGSGSVQPIQIILRENHKYIKCRGDSEIFKYIKRRGRSLWRLTNLLDQLEKWKKSQFLLLQYEYERERKRGATFQNVSSDHLYHDSRLRYL